MANTSSAKKATRVAGRRTLVTTTTKIIEPIPGPDLSMPVSRTTRLSSLRDGESATIKRVPDHGPTLLRHLQETGVIPGVKVKVILYSELDGNITLKIDGRDEPAVLGTSITDQVFVEIGEK